MRHYFLGKYPSTLRTKNPVFGTPDSNSYPFCDKSSLCWLTDIKGTQFLNGTNALHINAFNLLAEGEQRSGHNAVAHSTLARRVYCFMPRPYVESGSFVYVHDLCTPQRHPGQCIIGNITAKVFQFYFNKYI